jgi:hypothetical protein
MAGEAEDAEIDLSNDEELTIRTRNALLKFGVVDAQLKTNWRKLNSINLEKIRRTPGAGDYACRAIEALRRRLASREAREWDRQFEDDVRNGRLEDSAKEALDDVRNGRSSEL